MLDFRFRSRTDSGGMQDKNMSKLNFSPSAWRETGIERDTQALSKRQTRNCCEWMCVCRYYRTGMEEISVGFSGCFGVWSSPRDVHENWMCNCSGVSCNCLVGSKCFQCPVKNKCFKLNVVLAWLTALWQLRGPSVYTNEQKTCLMLHALALCDNFFSV